METQADQEVRRLAAVAYKNTIESLFKSIEKKAEENQETAETG